MATVIRTIPPITAKELITLQEFVAIPTYLIEELKDKPYSKIEAYIDILNMADESGGEFETTRRTLENRWGWSGRRVNSFLSELEERTIIDPRTNQKRTKIKPINTGFCDSKRTKNEPRTNQKRTKKINEDVEIYKRIIDYLNSRCGTRYTEKNKQTKESIHARLGEKFTEEDFYTVIDKKCNEWIGTEMERYLRPQTLFGTKFESYLNQNIVKDEKHTGNAYIDTIKSRVSDVDNW